MSFSSFQVGDAGSASWVGSCFLCCYWRLFSSLMLGRCRPVLAERTCLLPLFPPPLSQSIPPPPFALNTIKLIYLSSATSAPVVLRSWRKPFSLASNTNAIYSLTSNGEFLKCFTGNKQSSALAVHYIVLKDNMKMHSQLW